MNIKEIIKQPEGRRLEFKEQIPSGSNLTRTVITFSNDAGGEIFLGVKDEPGEIVGLNPDKIIFDDLKNYPEIELKWSEPGIAFRVTFRKKNYTPEMSEKTREKMSEKILWLIKDNPEISAKDLAYIVNRSSRTIERTVAKLKKEGRIKRIGPDKGGHWEVIK